MFKRKIYDQLLEWKNESDGRTAILVEGPRRVGKTTIVEAFVKNEYKSCIIINFAECSKDITELFDDISDLNFLFLQLQLKYKVDLYKRESAIVFDEVQFCPKARQAIKALVADRSYDYIETGSLISIKKNVKGILIPSEERHINMYPMDYEEFLWALNDNVTYNLLKKCFDSKKALGDAENRRQLRQFRLYMLIGGMPQAVNEYIVSNNFKMVDRVKRDILNLYEADLKKIDTTGKLSMLFDAIPAQLNSNASRYQVSSVIGGEHTDKILEYVGELADSKTVLVAYHANDPNTGLSKAKDLAKFKLFLCDTGLFTTLMFKDKDFTENIIYEKLLNDMLPVNLGYLYENAVAQVISTTGDGLFYYTMLNEISRHNYEIDFILSRGNKICPVEVKSSGYKTHKSLDVFCDKFSDRISNKYIIYTKDLKKERDILFVPIYMTAFI